MTKQERYFFVSYSFITATQTGTGQLPIRCDGMLNYKQAKKLCVKQANVREETLVITGFTEFKSEQDYEDFLAD